MRTRLESALEPVLQQLRADGYHLEAVLADDGVLECTVLAGPGACEECLVPKDLMGEMIADQCASAGISGAGVRLWYPAGA